MWLLTLFLAGLYFFTTSFHTQTPFTAFDIAQFQSNREGYNVIAVILSRLGDKYLQSTTISISIEEKKKGYSIFSRWFPPLPLVKE